MPLQGAQKFSRNIFAKKNWLTKISRKTFSRKIVHENYAEAGRRAAASSWQLAGSHRQPAAKSQQSAASCQKSAVSSRQLWSLQLPSSQIPFTLWCCSRCWCCSCCCPVPLNLPLPKQLQPFPSAYPRRCHLYASRAQNFSRKVFGKRNWSTKMSRKWFSRTFFARNDFRQRLDHVPRCQSM